MINLLRKYIDQVWSRQCEQSRLIEDFEELDEEDKIIFIKDLIKREPSEKKTNEVLALNDKVDRDLFIKLVLSVLEEFNNREILGNKASRGEIEDYLIEQMNIFRWENVENFEIVSRKIIVNQLLKENYASKSNTNPVDYFTSLTRGKVEESEVTLSEEGEDMRELSYNGEKDLQHKFDSINVVGPEARLFVNKILEHKNEEERIFKLVPYTASTEPGKATKSRFYIFCTEEKVEHINRYLHYERLDYQPSRRGRFVNKDGFFVD